MWLVLAADAGGSGIAELALNIVGPAGLIAAIVALLKLKPDANSQAVVAAQGAAAEWEKLYGSSKVDVAYWRARAQEAEKFVGQLAQTPQDYQRLIAIQNMDRRQIEEQMKEESVSTPPSS